MAGLDVLGRSARALLFTNPLYRLSLTGRLPDRFRAELGDPWPGDPQIGEQLLAGQIELVGYRWRIDPHDAWQSAPAPVAAAALHSFCWLAHLRAFASGSCVSSSDLAEARRWARLMVDDWIGGHDGWSELAWRPDVMGARLDAWIRARDFLLASADDSFERAVVHSVAKQSRHLARILPIWEGADPAGRFQATKGLIVSGAVLTDGDRVLEAGIGHLSRELSTWVLSDGTPTSRAASDGVQLARDMLDMRRALALSRRGLPPSVATALGRLIGIIRLTQHGDGGLSQLAGGLDLDKEQVDMVVRQFGACQRAVRSARVSGLERMSAGRMVVLFDTGTRGQERDRVTSTIRGGLGFEMSVGRQRVVISCGTMVGATDSARAWRDALSGPAAYSTLDVPGVEPGKLVRQRGLKAPSRRTNEAGTLIEAGYDGYLDRIGLEHWRRLFLAENGAEIIGEDTLIGLPLLPVRLRFHLDPSVDVALCQDPTIALLRTPYAGGWRLHATAPLVIAESVSLADGRVVRRCQQLVLEGQTSAGTATTFKWSIARA